MGGLGGSVFFGHAAIFNYAIDTDINGSDFWPFGNFPCLPDPAVQPASMRIARITLKLYTVEISGDQAIIFHFHPPLVMVGLGECGVDALDSFCEATVASVSGTVMPYAFCSVRHIRTRLPQRLVFSQQAVTFVCDFGNFGG